MMKTTLTLLVITFSTLMLKGNYNEPIVKTDKRIELLSVISRIAGFDEYKNNNLKIYSEKVDNHFFNFKEHEIISYLKQLRKERQIAYDAIMSLAIRIEIVDNSITLFDTQNLDSRWDKNNLDSLEKLLNEFYVLSDFESFYNSNKEFYEVATRKLTEATNSINYKWFSDFYGEINQDTYILVAGMLLGSHNYGPSVKINCKSKELYSIL
ncbi:DUF4932 domain-containing protein, partial [Perlabentimonas gracilis]|uniref:DUF4932 domain-containing protein n=1 Tax=Perlabentimonas gracilis TaxID=2715279 RepID=UPI00140D4220